MMVTSCQESAANMDPDCATHSATISPSNVWLPALGLNYLTVSEQEAQSQTCTVGATSMNSAQIWR